MNGLLLCAIIALVYFTLFYIMAGIIKNASILDIGWGFGFVLLAAAGFIQKTGMPSAVFLSIVGIWGLRLSYHIFRRNYKKPEDKKVCRFQGQMGQKLLCPVVSSALFISRRFNGRDRAALYLWPAVRGYRKPRMAGGPGLRFGYLALLLKALPTCN